MKRNRVASSGLVALIAGFSLLGVAVSGSSAENPRSSTTTPRATRGARAASVGTIVGRGGRRQVTYNHHPLYYYIGDQGPGDTQGQGVNQFGALWYVLSPSGNAITTAQRR
jgi:secreted repeat protein with Y-X4-D motif